VAEQGQERQYSNGHRLPYSQYASEWHLRQLGNGDWGYRKRPNLVVVFEAEPELIFRSLVEKVGLICGACGVRHEGTDGPWFDESIPSIKLSASYKDIELKKYGTYRKSTICGRCMAASSWFNGTFIEFLAHRVRQQARKARKEVAIEGRMKA
jgi:hypothetical protein